MEVVVIQLASFLVSVGIIYGTFNTRIKALERQLNDFKDIRERLARIEEQTKMLTDYLIKQIK
jgi:hypothetical protein